MITLYCLSNSMDNNLLLNSYRAHSPFDARAVLQLEKLFCNLQSFSVEHMSELKNPKFSCSRKVGLW